MTKTVFRATGKSGPPKHTKEVAAGEFIFREDELGTEMYIVHEGQVEILENVGAELKRLAVMEKGDFFGEMSLLDDLPRNASARALTDAKLLRINGSMFVQMLRKEPEIAIRIMRKFSRRLRDADRMLKRALGGNDSTRMEASSDSQSPANR
ncbi:MAG: cyclic nucleotide-binding domain-containing protein, partial [Acidobacteria bacterium]|nr:cyclic nucleotide-binding domain-containing protein [Acidobacteriota bacterium]